MKRPTRGSDVLGQWRRWRLRYLKYLEGRGFAAKTLLARDDYVSRFSRFAEESALSAPDQLTPSVIDAYISYRREKPNRLGRRDRPKTVNTHIMAIKGFLEYLVREGVISMRVAEAAENLRDPAELPKATPSDAEVRKMLEGVDVSRSVGIRDRAILEVLYSTGMRRQELCDLEVGDVDLEDLTIRIVCGKGGKGRMVPVGRTAAGWVRRYLLAVRPTLLSKTPGGRRSPLEGDWLFLSKTGKKLDGASVRRVVVVASRRALGKSFSPHALRRACATEMIRNNANPYHVKELLGHEDLTSMDSYAKLLIVDLKRAHSRFHPRDFVAEEES